MLQTPEPPLSSPASTTLLSLDRLPEGASGIVRRVEGGDESERSRLTVLGLCVGRRVRTVRAGNPRIVGVFHGRVGIADELARLILVEPTRDERR